jgi:hypothetical protein
MAFSKDFSLFLRTKVLTTNIELFTPFYLLLGFCLRISKLKISTTLGFSPERSQGAKDFYIRWVRQPLIERDCNGRSTEPDDRLQ